MTETTINYSFEDTVKSYFIIKTLSTKNTRMHTKAILLNYTESKRVMAKQKFSYHLSIINELTE